MENKLEDFFFQGSGVKRPQEEKEGRGGGTKGPGTSRIPKEGKLCLLGGSKSRGPKSGSLGLVSKGV